MLQATVFVKSLRWTETSRFNHFFCVFTEKYSSFKFYGSWSCLYTSTLWTAYPRQVLAFQWFLIDEQYPADWLVLCSWSERHALSISPITDRMSVLRAGWHWNENATIRFWKSNLNKCGRQCQCQGLPSADAAPANEMMDIMMLNGSLNANYCIHQKRMKFIFNSQTSRCINTHQSFLWWGFWNKPDFVCVCVWVCAFVHWQM